MRKTKGKIGTRVKALSEAERTDEAVQDADPEPFLTNFKVCCGSHEALHAMGDTAIADTQSVRDGESSRNQERKRHPR